MLLNASTTWLWALALTAQLPTADGGLKAEPAARLHFMKDAAQSYEIRIPNNPRALTLQPDPAFRLGNQPADNVADGAIFLWTDEISRPTVAVQVFLVDTGREPEGLWAHEFTSLATGPVRALRRGQVAWYPDSPGIDYRPVPRASAPAASAAQRLRQMHEIAQGFKAQDNFKGRGWSELRLLAKPIARYGAPGSETVDGALFPFVLGTDTELFLFLEAKTRNGGLEWRYALAPMTVFALRANYGGETVWSLPDRAPQNGPSWPFFTNTNTR